MFEFLLQNGKAWMKIPRSRYFSPISICWIFSAEGKIVAIAAAVVIPERMPKSGAFCPLV